MPESIPPSYSEQDPNPQPISLDEHIGALRQLKDEYMASIRPIHDFLDKDRFSLTISFPEIMERWNRNLPYYSGNYLLIGGIYTLFCLITSGNLVFPMLFFLFGFYLLTRLRGQLTIGRFTIPTSTLYAAFTGASLMLLLLSGVTGALLWIAGATGLTVLSHAAVMKPSAESEYAAVDQV